MIVEEDLRNNYSEYLEQSYSEYEKDYLTDMRLDGGVGHGFSTEGRTCGHSSLA